MYFLGEPIHHHQNVVQTAVFATVSSTKAGATLPPVPRLSVWWATASRSLMAVLAPLPSGDDLNALLLPFHV